MSSAAPSNSCSNRVRHVLSLSSSKQQIGSSFRIFKNSLTKDKSFTPSSDSIDTLLEKFWVLDSVGIETISKDTNSFSFEELEAIKIVKNGSYYAKDEKCWYVVIPWKTDDLNLGDNYGTSFQILKSVEKSVISKKLTSEVNEAFNEMFSNNFARKLSFTEFRKNTKKNVSYIPSFPVFTPDKEKTKVRIVMNASSKTQSKLSINDQIFSGPSLLPDLTVMLIRFRTGPIAFTFDVQKMFLNIKLSSDRDKRQFRFLWRNCDPSVAPSEYEMDRLLFGLNCAPFIANFIVKEHAKLFEKDFPIGAKIAASEVYIDDIITCLSDEDTCLHAINELIELFSLATMHLHKFNSNSKYLKGQLLPSQVSNTSQTKILGQVWDVEKDLLTFNFTKELSSDAVPCTKRKFLSEAGTLFDPLGLISPILFVMKLLFQRIWVLKLGWDERLPADISHSWANFKAQIPKLTNFTLPRCLFGRAQVLSHKLLTFCDASNDGYAAVCYLFTEYVDTSTQTTFIMSKTRVRPVKNLEVNDDVSIVRLELLSMLIGVRLSKHVLQALSPKITVQSSHFFCDSAINFHRLHKGYASFKQWVANRLKEILCDSAVDNWIHIPSELNGADIASRGCLSFDEFLSTSEWLNGPAFLRDPQPWSSYSKVNDRQSSTIETDLEIKPMDKIRVVRKPIINDLLQILRGRFSSWIRTVKLLAFILRFASRTHKCFRGRSFTTAEFSQTENFLFAMIQKDQFPNDYSLLIEKQQLDAKSKLGPFTPFVDHLLLRSNSRLSLSQTLTRSEKFPIILPSHDNLIERFILHLHLTNHHLGLSHLLALVRSKFVIFGGRREVSRILRLCPTRNCKKVIPLSQLMSALPSERIDGTEPFMSVALDYFGPLYYIGFDKEQKLRKKVWVLLITDFLSRAVHLELVLGLGTEEFLSAFRLFVSRRGLPRLVYSDNAAQFKAADRELKIFISKISWSKVGQFAVERGFDWSYSLPYTPHMNGVCERLVRTIKTPLRKTLGTSKVTFRQLQVILTEIESVVNSRPIVPVQDDIEVPITPFHLINGRPYNPLPSQKNSKGLAYPDLWLKRKQLMQIFWRTFKRSYLLSQGLRRKWQQLSATDLVGRVVLLNDANSPQYRWPVGVVDSCITSKDNVIRTVIVRTGKGLIKRSVNTISLFESDFLTLSGEDSDTT